MRSQLNFAVANLDESNKRDLGYERLAIRFDLFGPQLTIAGVCRQLRGYEFLDDGVVLTAGGLSIVSSRSEPQSWASLVRAFWQDGRETLPVSGQSAWLLSVLPAPQRLSHPSGEMLGALPARPPRFTGTVTADPAIAQGTEPGVLQAMPPIVQPD